MKNYIALLHKVLPDQLKLEFENSYGKSASWDNNTLSKIFALIVEKVDWDAYLREYKDIAQSGLHPAYHYIKFGIAECRSVKIKSIISSKLHIETPKVSIILLGETAPERFMHSLFSLLDQSLKEIEVIIICHGEARITAMIKALAKSDQRIRIIQNSNSKSLREDRIIATANATGKYIMFVEAPDYLLPDTCQTVLQTAADKWDMICFGSHIIWNGVFSARERKLEIAARQNKSPAIYYGSGILDAIFLKGFISPLICPKLYAANVAKKALLEIARESTVCNEDEYELLALARNAKSACVIESQFYVHHCDSGAKFNNQYNVRLEGFNQIINYCTKHGLEQYFKVLLDKYLSDDIEYWLTLCDPAKTTVLFNTIAEKYGILSVVEYLHSKYEKNWKKVAEKFQYYTINPKTKKIKNVGIYYPIISIGGVETALASLTEKLIDIGLNIILFLRVSTLNNLKINPRIKIVYLSNHDYWGVKNNSLYQFYEYVTRFSIDIMLFQENTNRYQLWETIILKYLGISSVLFYHNSFYHTLSHKNIDYDLKSILSVCKCLDKVICVSSYAELFMRVNGIDAKYIPNAISFSNITARNSISERGYRLIVNGRLSEPVKQINDCLKIFKYVKEKLSEAEIIFVGSFDDHQKRKDFDIKAEKLGLSEAITITGWTQNVIQYLDQSAVMLSTSWTEGFGLALAEAQARGLPVIMYDLPIDLARANESVITVAQNNQKGAAEEIIKLLTDKPRLRRLSKIAKQNSLKFNLDRYVADIIDCIFHIHDRSDVEYYSQDDYKKVLRALAYHSANLPPWHLKI